MHPPNFFHLDAGSRIQQLRRSLIKTVGHWVSKITEPSTSKKHVYCKTKRRYRYKYGEYYQHYRKYNGLSESIPSFFWTYKHIRTDWTDWKVKSDTETEQNYEGKKTNRHHRHKSEQTHTHIWEIGLQLPSCTTSTSFFDLFTFLLFFLMVADYVKRLAKWVLSRMYFRCTPLVCWCRFMTPHS